MISFQTKRIYEDPSPDDGFRVLVDRLWPRGVSKEVAQIDLWLGDIAPSHGLRKWFGHNTEKWPAFVARYHEELDQNPGVVTELFQKAGNGRITLLYAAKDTAHNNAVALKNYLIGE